MLLMLSMNGNIDRFSYSKTYEVNDRGSTTKAAPLCVSRTFNDIPSPPFLPFWGNKSDVMECGGIIGSFAAFEVQLVAAISAVLHMVTRHCLC